MSNPTTTTAPTRDSGSEGQEGHESEEKQGITNKEPSKLDASDVTDGELVATSEGGRPSKRLAPESADNTLKDSHEPAKTDLKPQSLAERDSTGPSHGAKPLSSRPVANHNNNNTNAPKKTKPESSTGASASLPHRLAGPSVGKAGLARDQTEITRIIAKASEGSKYYENERRRDEEVEKKIEVLLKQRDSLRSMANIPQLEALADKAIAELEATRDLSQKIVHLDMDSFYASIEILRDPSLADKPFGVGSEGGVLSTASYAARAYGCRSGMATYIARALCPQLIVVKTDWVRIGETSKQVMDILSEYCGDPDGEIEGQGMSVAGVDEAYINITGYCEAHEITAEDCVTKIRAQIFEETKLTASAGIAPNKTLAKICSERNKPNGQFSTPFDPAGIVEFMKTLPIRRIPGIGRVTERFLEAVDIRTCGDIYTHRATLALLDKHLHMRDKLEIYLGLGLTQVKPWPREARKSVGSERTFKAIDDPAKIQEKLEMVAHELEEDLEKSGFAGHTVTLKLKLDTFETRQRAKSARKPVSKYEELVAVGQELLAQELPLKLRLLGLRVTNLKDMRAPETGIKKFFGHSTEAAAPPSKRRKIEGKQGEKAEEKRIYVVEDDSGDENLPAAGTHRAATATPEKPRTQPHTEDPYAHRASSHEPMGSQDFFVSEEIPHTAKRKRPNIASNEAADPTMSKQKQPTKSRPPTSTEQHVCPICSKTLQTDNAGLNAHVDWCLSRSAIMEASASASTSATSAGTKQGPKGAKGGSTKGGAKGGKQDIRLAWRIS